MGKEMTFDELVGTVGYSSGCFQSRIKTGQATRNISSVLVNRWGEKRAEASCG